MTLAPYPRRVARVATVLPLRWPDIPVGAVRQAGIDVSLWEAQVTADAATSVAASVTPDDGGLVVTGAAVAEGIAGATLTPASGGIGTDYAVTLTVTTAGGRIEPFVARVLVTDPTA